MQPLDITEFLLTRLLQAGFTVTFDSSGVSLCFNRATSYTQVEEKWLGQQRTRRLLVNAVLDPRLQELMATGLISFSPKQNKAFSYAITVAQEAKEVE